MHCLKHDHCLLAIVLASALSACGSPPAATTTTPDRSAPPPLRDTGIGVIASRVAPIPAASASERLVFLKAGSVWIMGPDGQASEQLTVRSLDAADQGPRVSPDGRTLVYASAKDGTLRLYLQSMEDLIPTTITEGTDNEAAWSPDGSKLAFMHGDERVNRDLYVLEIDTDTDPKQWHSHMVLQGDDDHPELAGAPMWSIDGKSLVLSADRRQHQGTTLWQVDLASGIPKRISPLRSASPWTHDRWATPSPDGKRIVFASNRHTSSGDSASDYDVYSMKFDGSGLTRLSDDPGKIAHPVYSSDGKRLYFASTRVRRAGFEWEIFVMASGGGEQRRLTREERPENSTPSVATQAWATYD